ncbi:peptidase MA family metallohydrolase [Candidatus Neomarinimicrobiota bacterium]
MISDRRLLKMSGFRFLCGKCGPVWVLLLLLSVLNGQFYFGRNKIQYESFDWQVLTTPHFQLFYYPEEEILARAAAFWAEETFAELEQKFNHTLSSKVPLVIYSNHLHFQQTNTTPYLIPEGVGGFFEFIKGRVVLPNDGSMFGFRRVIRHELVHVFTQSKINTSAEAAGIWVYAQPPLWFHEGLAEWWAGGWDTEAEMVIRDALLHDYLVPLENLSLSGAGFLLYKEGQSFLRYLEEEYGADCIRQIMEECYLYDTFEEVLTAVTGQSYEELTKGWNFGLKQAIAGALARQSLPGQNVRQLTGLGANVGPAVYQDTTGKAHVAYLSTRDGYTNIYSRALEDPEEQVVVRGERSPDKESLHPLQSALSVSSDGVLAFVAKSYERDAIRLFDLKYLEPSGEFANRELTTIRSPDWSPECSRIVFSAQDLGGQTDIYLWDLSADSTGSGESGMVRLSDDIYLDRDPCFSPDGRSIVFSSDRGRPTLDGGTNLFVLNLEDDQIDIITSGPYQDQRPRWSADNPGVIHFVSDRSGTPNIWRLNLLPDTLRSNLATMPPVNIEPRVPSLSLSAITDLHTGAIDVFPLPGDSLLITAFQQYSYQLHLTRAGTKQTQPYNEITNQDSTAGSWRLPLYQGEASVVSQPYRLKYSLDIAQTAVAQDPIYGFLGGAQLSISDMLGNRYYHLLLANTAQVSSRLRDNLNFSVTAVNLTHRANYAWGVFRFANQYINPYQGYFFEDTRGARVAVNYPFNVFRRVELSGSLWKSHKEFDNYSEPKAALLLSNYISFVHDNSLWQSTGPVDGWCLRVTGGQTFDLERKKRHNYTTMFDGRVYWRLSRTLTFAQRSMVWYNAGTDIRRFYIGGSWGLRGYGLTRVYGRGFIMLNQELRFPFARSLVLNLRSTSLGMAPIRAALFFDMGRTWEETWDDVTHDLIGSYGLGFRAMFMGFFVLRLDIGKRTDFHSKDSALFTQLFFGWDY